MEFRRKIQVGNTAYCVIILPSHLKKGVEIVSFGIFGIN